MALGLWIGRRVHGSADFFVAGRSSGPASIFSTMLAANIGAGSTVERDRRSATATGVAAWWWVGSAAHRLGGAGVLDRTGDAARRGRSTICARVGDYLEFRYGRSRARHHRAAAVDRLDLHPRRRS